jgi:hypothetical protein
MSHYLTLEEWNEQTIEERANFLFGKAIEIWKTKKNPSAIQVLA